MRPKSGEVRLTLSQMSGTSATFSRDVCDAVKRLRRDKRPDMYDAALARWALPLNEIEAILRSKPQRVQCAYRVCGHPEHPPL
jgi:hypothetical protein